MQAETLSSNLQNCVSFSTEEQDTGIKWINGKSIYQKTIVLPPLPNGNGLKTAHPHGISNLEQVVDFRGSFTKPSTSVTVVDNTPGSREIEWNVTVYVEAGHIYMFAGVDRSDYTKNYFTMWYTKK